MDIAQRLIEKLVKRRIRNTGESQAVATANVMAAFEKLQKNEAKPELVQVLSACPAEADEY